jgi:hypothetical protein
MHVPQLSPTIYPSNNPTTLIPPTININTPHLRNRQDVGLSLQAFGVVEGARG